MKKILFDLSVCQPMGKSKYHGGGVYGYIVFETLIQRYPNDVIAYYDTDRFLPSHIQGLIMDKKICRRSVQDNTILDLYLKEEFESLYTPLWSNSYFSLFPHNVPIISTIHGLRALEMNKDSYEPIYAHNFKTYVKALIKRTPIFHYIQYKYYRSKIRLFAYNNLKLVTVSEHSKASIRFYYPAIKPNQIKVFYSPNTSIDTNQDSKIFEKYYLIVSANRWLKNAYRAILAFDKIIQFHQDFKGNIIITGISENSPLLKKLKNKNRFKTLGYIEREDLENLYRNAYALIYPSLNEGFGYPPIEAMKYGTPVIASSFGSISEICGEAPLYVNPYSIDEIGIRILELDMPKIYTKKRDLSINQYLTVKKRQDEDLNKLIEFIING